MKKIISMMLCTVMLISSCCLSAFAAEPESPVILISGFMCSQLFTDFGTQEQEKVWGLNASSITDKLKSDLRGFLSSAAGAVTGDVEQFGERVGTSASQIMEKLMCNPDGSSVLPVEHYPNDPAINNIAYMLENASEYIYERNFCEYMAGKTDASRLFCFQYDSRLDAVTLAEELGKFIENVREYTGADKVKLFALSYGGLIVSTYLTLYGEEFVDRAVLSVPALGGTNIPERIFHGDVELAEKSIISFVETALSGAANFSRIFDEDRVEWLSCFASSMSSGLTDIIKNWGSIWSLCSQATYDELKSELLDSEENARLIENTDIIHNEVMPNLTATFEKCRASGTQISIICGTGSQLALGGDLNGDVILPASGVSGALTAPLGRRFPDGYTGAGTVCTDKSHNHVSPSMEIDASSAYLPENTWFVEGHYHGQYYYEEYTRSLVTALLLTDDIKNVYSDAKYPQFAQSNNSYRTLGLSFNNSGTAYLTDRDTALVVKNLSTDNYIKVLSVICDGVELKFRALTSAIIAPGKSVEIPFDGDIPKLGSLYSRLTVNYIKIGSINPLCTAELDITLMNGEAKKNSNSLTEKQYTGKLEAVLPEFVYAALRKLSLHKSAECLYNTVRSWFE